MTVNSLVAPPFLVASLLLTLSGVGKIRSPFPLMKTLKVTGLPSSRRLVLLLGVCEVVLGMSAIIAGGRLAPGSVAAMYALFSLFLALILTKHVPVPSCGCLGQRELPPSRAHLALNLIAVVFSALAAIVQIPGVLRLTDQLGYLATITFAIGIGTLSYSTYLLVALLPPITVIGKAADVIASSASGHIPSIEGELRLRDGFDGTT